MADVSDRMVFHVSKDETVNNLMVKFSSRALASNKKHGNTINKVEKSTKPVSYTHLTLPTNREV